VTPEPEREMVRTALPLFAPALLVALVAGAILGGPRAAWSAGAGIVVVMLNFTVHGLSLARAARRSLTTLAAVAALGVVVRLAVIVAAMAVLKAFTPFSPLAFGLAVAPATIALISYELKVTADRSWRWWQFPGEERSG
jgi:F0F1-type ATP synthase assembly protein I